MQKTALKWLKSVTSNVWFHTVWKQADWLPIRIFGQKIARYYRYTRYGRTREGAVRSFMEKIKEKLRKKAPWIMKQQSFFLSFQPKTPARKFVSGETHLYLGRQYRLRVKTHREEQVKLEGKFIEIKTADKSRVKRLLSSWYLENAKVRFPKIANPLIEKFKKYNVEPEAIVIREMSRRWGSCTPKGKILLNPELMKAPRGCIEYVITHELCHLVYQDHTQKFFELQAKQMRNWEKWKMKLEKLLA